MYTMLYDFSGRALATKSQVGIITVAASDSLPIDKYRADYVCDGVNDRAIIQELINNYEKGGIIQFANGHYYINEFVVYDGYYYGLYFPKIRREIILRGCNHNHRYGYGTQQMTDNAAVIEVTQTAFDNLPSNQESYVIGSSRDYEFPYKVIGLEDLTVKIPNYTKPLIGFDGSYCADMHVDHCFMYSTFDDTRPDLINPKCIGIRCCGQGNIGYNFYLTHNKLVGWGTCYQLSGEHLIMIDCLGQNSGYGFLFGTIDDVPHPRNNTGMHPLTLINCAAEANTICGLYFGRGFKNPVEIHGFNLECSKGASDSWYNSNPWYSRTPLSADDDSEFCGTLTYSALRVNAGWTHEPVNLWDTIGHAKKFKTRDLTAPLSGTTAERPTDPVYLSQYFDTTLNKMLTWNGTAWV